MRKAMLPACRACELLYSHVLGRRFPIGSRRTKYRLCCTIVLIHVCGCAHVAIWWSIPRTPADSYAAEYKGFRHTLQRYHYGEALGWQGFCGGATGFTHWLSREDLLACIEHFGFYDIRIEFDHPDHPNGPALGLVAMR